MTQPEIKDAMSPASASSFLKNYTISPVGLDQMTMMELNELFTNGHVTITRVITKNGR